MLSERHKMYCMPEAMLAVLDHFDIQLLAPVLVRRWTLARPSQWSPPVVPNPSCTRSPTPKVQRGARALEYSPRTACIFHVAMTERRPLSLGLSCTLRSGATQSVTSSQSRLLSRSRTRSEPPGRACRLCDRSGKGEGGEAGQ